jgi:hypothetical protein
MRQLLLACHIVASLLLVPRPSAAQVPLAEYAERRAALASRVADGVFVARGAVSPVQDYMAFFQSPGFLYLSGYLEADATLLMTKKGSDVRCSLFVQGRSPAQEVWSGRRNGPAGAAKLTGMHQLVRLRLPSIPRSPARDADRPGTSRRRRQPQRRRRLVPDARAIRSSPSSASGARPAARHESAAELELIRKASPSDGRAPRSDAHRQAG